MTDTPDQPPLEHDVELLAARLLEHTRPTGPVAVAYSGGADSALVLAAAAKAHGPQHVLAITAVSESLATGELDAAAAFADHLRVRHLTPRTHELDSPGYRANGQDRCYFCKSTVLDTIGALAKAEGFETIATGTNADDATDLFRPGIRAGMQRNVRTPLLDAALTKHDVRRISRHWQLPTWDKPATPCLASRIRYGLEVTSHRLARIDLAEAAVRRLLHDSGLSTRDLRVRDLGQSVRVEVDATIRPQAALLAGLADALASAGFVGMPSEVDTFQSGRLNRLPPQPPSSEPPVPAAQS